MQNYDWIHTLAKYEKEAVPCVLVTVIDEKGSVPRSAGTKMLVTADGITDTIGGGHLEHMATQLARKMLENRVSSMQIERFNLGASLGQCCGGMVSICLEPIMPQRYPLMLFGAGHVAKALVPILASLPFSIIWVDEREEQFPDNVPENVETKVTDDPVAEVSELAANGFYLVMTHNHHLDFELTKAILKKGDSRYFGVIGSETKRKRFEHRLKQRDFSPEQINSMICPIGISNVAGKHPSEIAVSVAGELIGYYQTLENKAQNVDKMAENTLTLSKANNVKKARA
ncbi:xanthine dehydrogenase accessory protein XdhC [Veronia pacifica]|uniref:Xanthine dehydrogenase accessory protein XdhC n=1 Tax=Veronia pacifica TaxID=1080227 RepID=A0A1C3EFZ0_9GAMM|nr:xanthine dehydrogenase accessory protein XdhC [Veronia pacifica]ODA32162.1 xanthine dehydrogenase accessory protein XdhC [Veronia pacifica]